VAYFVLRRVALGILVVFGVVTITFVIARVVPSDPASQWAGPRATPEQREQARKELGLDKPLIVQFGEFVEDLARLDLGESLANKRSVSSQISRFLPATLELVGAAILWATVVALPLGILSAKWKNRWPDHVARVISVGAISVPTFWLGLMLQLIFCRWLDLLPLGGQLSIQNSVIDPVPGVTGFLLIDTLLAGRPDAFVDYVEHLVLPALALGAGSLATISRMTRSAMLEILNEDYILAARSYGLPEGTVLWKLGLKNSLGPTVTVMALTLGWLLVNTFLVEAIFNWPGIGNYINSSVETLDYPSIMGVTLVSAIAYVILNLLADIVIAMDPRVRQ